MKSPETIPYCGGANPGEEILKKSTEKKIALGQVFYIIRGNTNTSYHIIIDSFKVDGSGKNCVSLKPGTYSLINEFSYKKLVINDAVYDRECLKKLWSTPLAVFKIKNNTWIRSVTTFSNPALIIFPVRNYLLMFRCDLLEIQFVYFSLLSKA